MFDHVTKPLLLQNEKKNREMNAGKMITKGMIDISGHPNLAAAASGGKTKTKIGKQTKISKDYVYCRGMAMPTGLLVDN